MISLIVCSRTARIPQELHDNVEATIGCSHEWVVVDNSRHNYNIFQAYNRGVSQANGDILCFMHDDLRYHTQGWGLIAQNAFAQHASLGLLGVAGAHVVPNAPAPMWEFQHISTVRIWSKEPLSETPFDMYGPLPDGGYWSGNTAFANGQSNVAVANVDGLWMCCRASLFREGMLRFDEENYDGFHCYDADLSMQVLSKGYDIMVNTEILVEHFSQSMLTPDYFKAADKWYAKWKSSLPIVRGVDLSDQMLEVVRCYTLDARHREEHLIEIGRLRNTHAFKIGKALLSPVRCVKRLLK